MREDNLEALDKMFPEGYMICYTIPQGEHVDLRMSYFNPNKAGLLYEAYDLIKTNLTDTDDRV